MAAQHLSAFEAMLDGDIGKVYYVFLQVHVILYNAFKSMRTMYIHFSMNAGPAQA